MLRADHVKIQNFGYLLASKDQDFVPPPGGSDGNLCLGGTIGRFVEQTRNAQGWGTICVSVDLVQMPPPLQSVVPGETWNFQVWFRDGSSSNFSDAVSITFE